MCIRDRARSLKLELHGVNSDQVLQIPIIGLSSKAWSGKPWFFIQDRWMKPSRSLFPYHKLLLRFFVISYLNNLLSMWVYSLELYTYFLNDVEPERRAIMTPAKVIQSIPSTCNVAIG